MPISGLIIKFTDLICLTGGRYAPQQSPEYAAYGKDAGFFIPEYDYVMLEDVISCFAALDPEISRQASPRERSSISRKLTAPRPSIRPILLSFDSMCGLMKCLRSRCLKYLGSSLPRSAFSSIAVGFAAG